jgi:hypothetical protein
VAIRCEDVLKADISEATVVVLYAFAEVLILSVMQPEFDFFHLLPCLARVFSKLKEGFSID